jgi:hypothetical protein
MLFDKNLFCFIYSHIPTPSHFNTEVYCVRFMGLMTVTLKIMTWNVIPCCLVEMYLCHF